MQKVRTTISLPQDIHEQLRLQAFQQRKSLGELIAEKVQQKKKAKRKKISVEDKIEQDIAFFRKVARSGKQIDLLKALREDRDRDNA